MVVRKEKITNYIFVHIPKTGGTSVATVLGCIDVTGHSTPARIIEEIGQDLWDSCFKFTLVRNPWDHAVSFYRAHKEEFNVGEKPVNTSTFGGWVLDGMRVSWQRDWIFGDQINDPIRMDQFIRDDMFVGRFEELQESLDYVSDQIGIAPLKVPHLNQSHRELDYRSYYNNQRVIDAVAERNKTIIDRFGYTY